MVRVICTDYDNDEQLFTRGACFVLAIVLYGETGYELIEICRAHDYDCHIMVKRPDGMYLDIRGYQTEEEVRERWGQHVDVGPADLYVLENEWTNPFDTEDCYARAMEIAPALIEGTYEQDL